MKTMSKEYYEQMKKKAEAVLEQKEDGVPVREIMARIYVDGLKDKTMKQGLIMADKAMEAIDDFKRAYAEAVDDKATAVEEIVARMLEEKSLVERCNILAKLFAGSEAAKAKMAGEDKDACDEILRNADGDQITEAEATEELLSELEGKVLESFRNAAILSRGMRRQADQLDALIAENGISQMVVQIGEDEAEYEGVVTMISYVESKTADVRELPPDLTIEETAYIVAATVEEEQIVKRYTAGEIAMNVAVALLDILGVVLLLKLAVGLIALGVAVATSLCGMVVAIPAVILVTLGVMGVFGEAVKVWNTGAKAVAGIGAAVVKLGVRAASAAMRKIGDFISTTMAPIGAGIAAKVKRFFNTKAANGTVTTVKTAN